MHIISFMLLLIVSIKLITFGWKLKLVYNSTLLWTENKLPELLTIDASHQISNLYCIWYCSRKLAKSVAARVACPIEQHTVYPKKYAHGFCFAVLCCGYTLTDFPISIRLTSLALWQSNDCPSASRATLMNMDKYFIWIHYKRLHNHNKAKHNKTVCIFLGIYCKS